MRKPKTREEIGRKPSIPAAPDTPSPSEEIGLVRDPVGASSADTIANLTADVLRLTAERDAALVRVGQLEATVKAAGEKAEKHRAIIADYERRLGL
jgi:uncharacterized metal-binding protein